jgi:hypothetical protein
MSRDLPAKAFALPSKRAYPLMDFHDGNLEWDYDLAESSKAQAGRDLDGGFLTRRQYQTILQKAEFAMSQSKSNRKQPTMKRKAAKKKTAKKKAAKKSVRKTAKKNARARGTSVQLMDEQHFLRNNPSDASGGTIIIYPPEAPQMYDSNAGSDDEVFILPEKRTFYVLSFNTSKGYVDLEAFSPDTGIKVAEAYTDDPDEIAKILPEGMATPPGLMFTVLKGYLGRPQLEE